eukprot:1177894-Prorocentrum_minimum.AAC.3
MDPQPGETSRHIYTDSLPGRKPSAATPSAPPLADTLAALSRALPSFTILSTPLSVTPAATATSSSEFGLPYPSLPLHGTQVVGSSLVLGVATSSAAASTAPSAAAHSAVGPSAASAASLTASNPRFLLHRSFLRPLGNFLPDSIRLEMR